MGAGPIASPGPEGASPKWGFVLQEGPLTIFVTLAYRQGRVERVCREIGRQLRCIVLNRRLQHRWSIALPMVRRLLSCPGARSACSRASQLGQDCLRRIPHNGSVPPRTRDQCSSCEYWCNPSLALTVTRSPRWNASWYHGEGLHRASAVQSSAALHEAEDASHLAPFPLGAIPSPTVALSAVTI